jgi:hypothetical protein
MTKTELKQKAQHELMSAMQAAFYSIADNYDDETAAELTAAADDQMKRVEKLFGYVPGSWARG